MFFPRYYPFKSSAHSLCLAAGPLTSLGQIHSWDELHSNQQDSHALQWIMTLISGAKLMRDCSHHLGQSCFSFWLQGRQGFTLQHSHAVSLALGAIHHWAQKLCGLNAQGSLYCWSCPCAYGLFQSVHSSTTQPLLRESEFNGAIELCHSELPYLSILLFLLTNASLSFKTLHFDQRPVLLWQYNKGN